MTAPLEPTFPIPFADVRVDEILPTVEHALAEAALRIQAIVEVEDRDRTFDNTVLALERATEKIEHAMRVLGHLEATRTSPQLRAAYNQAMPKVSAFASRIPLNSGLWRALCAFAETDRARALVGPPRRFFDKTVAEFRRQGAELDSAGKTRLEAIDVELATRTLAYAQNVVDATAAFELHLDDAARLKGLPESAKERARAEAEARGLSGWRFTLSAPSYVPAMTYLDDASVREWLYRAHVTRATSAAHDNREHVARILALRRERAALLGYRTFADLVLEDRMAQSATRARAFLDDMLARTRGSFARETAELAAFRCTLEGQDAPPLAAWDVGYYAEKLRQKLYAFDDEALRPYFPLAQVLEGAFEVARRVYGVRLTAWDDAPSWHPSVQSFKVIDERDGAWLAGIHVDPFPREEKRGGAWMDGLLVRARDDADPRHLGVLITNVTPPTAGREAQLTHGEVETVFHELGHLMHHTLSRAAIKSQAGTRVAWDFVELPSQLFENWCWEREALDLFARHVDTGATVPDALLSALGRARTFRAASAQMRQLGMALADLRLHTDYDPAVDGEPIAFARAVLEDTSPAPLPPEHALMASFDHLFSDPTGYAAGYYSYKWAEVLDADAFGRFRREGIFNQAVGQAFRERILARGDEDDPAQLFRDFMGRDPELGPLLERLGLVA
ncbi:MAG: M3 family peptidase [Myxococcales bacterium]|nr:M3 family peptidase [Myxococcales bacterium]